ncbi:DUF4369 domain-containing protein [Lacinutrix salivirga]
MKNILALLCVVVLFSCEKDTDKLIVNGHIKGLQKGTVYLKKNNDSTTITVDSLVIKGDSQFTLKSDIESPEIYYLYLNKQTGEENRVTFFADKGITEIKSTLKNFPFDAKINGSKQQKLLDDYLRMMSQFNNKNLNLIKENFEAQKDNDTVLANNTLKQAENLIKQKYRYTINFALTNKDSEVAPYLALTEAYNANITWLDSINNSLTKEVKTSKYGIELQNFIEKIKAEEQ